MSHVCVGEIYLLYIPTFLYVKNSSNIGCVLYGCVLSVAFYRLSFTACKLKWFAFAAAIPSVYTLYTFVFFEDEAS